jgi:hypothetical protein
MLDIKKFDYYHRLRVSASGGATGGAGGAPCPPPGVSASPVV